MTSVLLVAVIVAGLGFDFTNGFHDTANFDANLAGAFVTRGCSRCPPPE